MNNNRTNNRTNFVSTATRTSGLRFFLIAILIAVSVTSASAQAAVTECGARIYSAQPFAGGELCLYTSSTEDRARLALRPCAPDESRYEYLWRLTRRDGGGVNILSLLNGATKRMEVADFSKSDGATIQIWGPNFGDGYRSQTWDFVPVPGGNLIVNVESGKCLAVPLGRNRLDQEVPIQYTCSRASNFVWMVQSRLRSDNAFCR
jgi:hypothetical protein